MIWILGAIFAGLILGVIGFYFRAAFVLSALIISLYLYLYYGVKDIGTIIISEVFPEYTQWAALFFVIFFFVARSLIWLLTRFNILPQCESDIDVYLDPMEKTLREWDRQMNEGSSPF